MWGCRPRLSARAERHVGRTLRSTSLRAALSAAFDSECARRLRTRVLRNRGLQQPQSARRTHVGKFSVHKRLSILRLKMLQPVHHLGHRLRERTFAVGIEPLQPPTSPPSTAAFPPRAPARAPESPPQRLSASCTNQPTMIPGKRPEFWQPPATESIAATAPSAFSRAAVPSVPSPVRTIRYSPSRVTATHTCRTPAASPPLRSVHTKAAPANRNRSERAPAPTRRTKSEEKKESEAFLLEHSGTSAKASAILVWRQSPTKGWIWGSTLVASLRRVGILSLGFKIFDLAGCWIMPTVALLSPGSRPPARSSAPPRSLAARFPAPRSSSEIQGCNKPRPPRSPMQTACNRPGKCRAA